MKFLILLLIPINVFAADITLQWDANTETDLDHYNIYRSELILYSPSTKSWQFSEWEKIGESQTNTYTDSLPDDKIPLYSVTAVDAVGIESKFSNGAMLTFKNPSTIKNLRGE